MEKAKKDLVQIIRDNPGCVATIDNDCWIIMPARPKPLGQMTDDDYDAWECLKPLARSDDDLVRRGGGYGSGCTYGGDILQALAVIVGITVESV
jgi:hypothetical protein